jgi:hypothetical protein
MKTAINFACFILLTGCVAMPAAPPVAQLQPKGAEDMPSGELVFCTRKAPNTHCEPNTTGLIASGLGGLFLPLNVQTPSLKLEDGSARVALVVNNISAYCSAATPNVNTNPATIKFSGIYCNWLGIGNVIASLQLTIDSFIEEDIYGGRYRIRFFGTGNGGGAGYFMARKSS